jgi:hypothetical protein
MRLVFSWLAPSVIVTVLLSRISPWISSVVQLAEEKSLPLFTNGLNVEDMVRECCVWYILGQ